MLSLELKLRLVMDADGVYPRNWDASGDHEIARLLPIGMDMSITTAKERDRGLLDYILSESVSPRTLQDIVHYHRMDYTPVTHFALPPFFRFSTSISTFR